jgi:predicted amidohydrolase
LTRQHVVITAVNMRIGCLQFAPQVGHVSNNITRAEAVLSKADQNELDNLDLLVLPEMAFSGKPAVARPCMSRHG